MNAQQLKQRIEEIAKEYQTPNKYSDIGLMNLVAVMGEMIIANKDVIIKALSDEIQLESMRHSYQPSDDNDYLGEATIAKLKDSQLYTETEDQSPDDDDSYIRAFGTTKILP